MPRQPKVVDVSEEPGLLAPGVEPRKRRTQAPGGAKAKPVEVAPTRAVDEVPARREPPAGLREVRVRRVAILEPRPLATIELDDGSWRDLDALEVEKGALVRVLPPHDANEATIDALAARCRELGAEAVRAMPRASGPAVVRPEGKRERAKSERRRRTIREIVGALVEAAHTADREALRAAVEEHLTLEGL